MAAAVEHASLSPEAVGSVIEALPECAQRICRGEHGISAWDQMMSADWMCDMGCGREAMGGEDGICADLCEPCAEAATSGDYRRGDCRVCGDYGSCFDCAS